MAFNRVSEQVDGPYLLPPLQLTEDSLKTLMHVVKLNIGTTQRERHGFRIKESKKISFTYLTLKE